MIAAKSVGRYVATCQGDPTQALKGTFGVFASTDMRASMSSRRFAVCDTKNEIPDEFTAEGMLCCGIHSGEAKPHELAKIERFFCDRLELVFVDEPPFSPFVAIH